MTSGHPNTGNRWRPSPLVDETDRIQALRHLAAIREALNAAENDDQNEAGRDAQSWAALMLQSLVSIDADLLLLRSHLARVAQDAGLGTRAIAGAAGFSQATIAKMTRTIRTTRSEGVE